MTPELINYAVAIVCAVATFLLLKFLDHEKRIQKIEDVQGVKLDNISTELKEFQKEVRDKLNELTDMVHREKNQENQLDKTLTLLLQELSKDK